MRAADPGSTTLLARNTASQPALYPGLRESQALTAISGEKKRPFPAGAVVVKEKVSGSPQGNPDGVGIMIKDKQPEFRETGGWEFLYFPSPGGMHGSLRSCASCHHQAVSRD